MNAPTTIPDKMYSYPEAAARLGIALSTLRTWVSDGRIGYFKLGRTVRFSEAHLAAALEEHPAAEGGRR